MHQVSAERMTMFEGQLCQELDTLSSLSLQWMYEQLWQLQLGNEEKAGNSKLFGSASFSRSLVHWFKRVEGIELGNRVLVSVGLTETALQEITSVNQLSFIPEYRKHIGLGSLGTNLNSH